MSKVVTIPLIAKPQKLSLVLNGLTYNLTVRWCTPAQAWIMDIADVSDKPMITGMPLVTGADLLAQFAYKDIGGKLIVQTSNSPDTPPTFTNLGGDSQLYYVSP